MSLFDTAFTSSNMLAVFRTMYFYIAWTPSISGFDTAGTAGTRRNLGGYCQYRQYSGIVYCGHTIATIWAVRTLILRILAATLRILAALKYTGLLRWASETFWAGNAAWRDCVGYAVLTIGVWYCSYCEYWQQYVIVRYCPHCEWVCSLYFGFCTFILPELRVFRGCSILQVLPVLTIIWEDTASVGNILGLCTAVYYCHYMYGQYVYG